MRPFATGRNFPRLDAAACRREFERRALTQCEAAAEIGIALATLRRLLNGRPVHQKSIRLFADWLDRRPARGSLLGLTISARSKSAKRR